MVSTPLGPRDTLPDAAAADDAPLAANLVGGADARGTDRRAGGGYSRFVAWMKVLLPVLSIALIALVIAWPRLKSDDTFRIGFASVNMGGETESGMDNARYVGTDDQRRPFSVTADLARQLPGAAGEVSMELPKADLTLDDGTWLVLTADTGRYVRTQAVLDLIGGVNLFHDTGYEISTEHLSVDLKAGTAEGREPLNGHGPFGELKAQGLRLIDRGKVMYFTGPAQVTLYPPEGGQ